MLVILYRVCQCLERILKEVITASLSGSVRFEYRPSLAVTSFDLSVKQGEKPVPLSLCPTQIPHGVNWDRTRASAVRDRRLPA
jgi:hypothetical protein